MTFFSLSLWQQLFVTVLGVALGIPAGLYLARLWEKRSETKERRQLRQTLVVTLRRNLDLLSGFEEQLGATPIPLSIPAPLDLTILDATAARKYEVLASVSECEAVDVARYDLIRLNGKIGVVRQLVGHVSHDSHLHDVFRSGMKACIGDLGDARSSVSAALDALGVERNGP